MTSNRRPRSGHKHCYVEAAHIRGDIIEYAGEGNTPEEIAAELGVPVASVRQIIEEETECQNEPS